MTTIFRVIGAVLLIVASATAWAGAFTNYWYDVTYSGQTTNTGLFKSCTDAGGCSSISFNDNAQCDRSGSAMQTRVNAVAGLTIVSAIIALLGCILTAVSIVFSSGTIALPLAVFFSVLTAACAGSGIALFVYTYENWYFCDGNFCSEFNTLQNCSTKFDYSFFLVAATTGLGILALIALLIAFCMAKDDAPAGEGAQANEPHEMTSDNYQQRDHQQQQQQQQQDYHYQANNTIPEPPEGDWEFDPGSGLYWSDAEYLYLDTVNNQYFDPKSGQWYDPGTQRWYFKD